MEYEDSPKCQMQRRKLVEAIQSKGIRDARVLTAIGRIPRHLFMPESLRNKAYMDNAFPIGNEQTISQPYTVAYQTWLLNVEPGMKVLEVGTGSAYQAAVLAQMGAEVYTIERQKKFYDRNKQFTYLQRFSNLHFCYGDGYNGWPEAAPFHRILITAAPEKIPGELIKQLLPGGLLVAPVGRPGMQRMVRITKGMDNTITEEQFDHFAFVPMLPGIQNLPEGGASP
ncbi:protein-L-isoaspartate(D-aspartate) O-methyltransferase [Pseudoflavitalea rhizosphaerae]|uniref:protein-L-isoaspartate(D-aspartate) O-methyltransferase n=1 Tax=Pseudoflavitalea rhizosphaerae TaxID=1884793 RepID=UPI000F8D972A|nr:protein-L-isoaspartate(D-aspartate) O-methyltransferase [Pseudoflavitalea rhizosphaerae]